MFEVTSLESQLRKHGKIFQVFCNTFTSNPRATFRRIHFVTYFIYDLLCPDLSIAMTTYVYERAHSMQKMLNRVCLFFPMPTWARVSDLIGENGRSLSQWIHLGGVKAFLDDSLGSSSALFHEVNSLSLFYIPSHTFFFRFFLVNFCSLMRVILAIMVK